MAEKGNLKIYLFSGLGADRRVFERLSVPGELIHITWLKPLKDESLKGYCQHLIDENDILANQVLLGVSFGGIVAGEIAKLIPAKRVIIISSVRSRRELPPLFRLAGYLHLYTFLPYPLLKKPNILLRFAFSPLSNEDYALLKRVVADTDIAFLKWAIKQVLLWHPDTPVHNLIHLHGTADKIFPSTHIQRFLPVKNGGHFMVYNRAEEINTLLAKMLLQG